MPDDYIENYIALMIWIFTDMSVEDALREMGIMKKYNLTNKEQVNETG